MMRCLLALLTTIALLYACRQESPERQIPEPPITTGGELTGQGPTLSLSADVLPLGRVAGDFDASDEPRSTTGRIDPKAEDGKFIKLLAQSDSTHPGQLLADLYIYRRKGGERMQVIHLRSPLRVGSEARSLSLRTTLSIDEKRHPEQASYLREMIRDQMKDCYLSMIIGLDEQGRFRSKGALRIPRWGSAPPLPDGFVVLRSEDNPLRLVLDERVGGEKSIRLRAERPMRLRMMGYLMVLRFENDYPRYIIKQQGPEGSLTQEEHLGADGRVKYFRAERPPFEASILLSGTLSATQDLQMTFADGHFGLNKYRVKREGQGWVCDYSDHYEGRPDGGYPFGDDRGYDYLIARFDGGASRTALSVPTRTTSLPRYPSEDESVVLIYFPNAEDQGAITYDGARWEGCRAPFYDDTPYTQYQVRRKAGKAPTVYIKAQTTGRTYGNTIEKKAKGADNKVYYVTFRITGKMTPKLRIKGVGYYTDYQELYQSIHWEEID